MQLLKNNLNWIPYPRYLLRYNLLKSIISTYLNNSAKGFEFGYGSGYFFRLIKDKLKIIYGYDFSNTAFETASALLKNYNISNVKLINNFPDDNMIDLDYIFSFEVLEHIKEDEQILEIFNNMLKKGGKLLISVPSDKQKFSIIDKAVGHYRRYSKLMLKKKLELFNFKVILIWSYGFPISNILDYYNKYYYKKSNINNPPEQLSKTSYGGKPNIYIKMLSNNIILYPFYIIQKIFKNTNLGTGYIVLAEKIN